MDYIKDRRTSILSNREFLGDEFWKACQQDYQSVRVWLKAGAQPREMLPVYRAFDTLYKGIL